MASSFVDFFSTIRPCLEKTAGEPLRKAGEFLYIYGAGNVGKDLCRVLQAHGMAVDGFLDRRAEPGAMWEEVPVYRLDAAVLSQEQRARSHVIVGIFNRETEMPPILRSLAEAGFGRVTSFLEIHDRFATELGDRFWLTAQRSYLDWQTEIQAVDGLWSDEASRQLYRDILRFRLTGDHEALPPHTAHDQYFPTGLPAWPTPVRFIDCGAYDGDTVRQLLERHVPIDALAAFEPDAANFSRLVNLVRENEAMIGKSVSLFPCGVDARTATLRFSSGQGSASRLSDQGETIIQCVALDEALPVFSPTVIKMDIEGAEFHALLGAERMIRRHRPGLAISVYHSADHLWKIPGMIQGWLGGGKHYLRCHAFNGFELIYYLMP